MSTKLTHAKTKRKMKEIQPYKYYNNVDTVKLKIKRTFEEVWRKKNRNEQNKTTTKGIKINCPKIFFAYRKTEKKKEQQKFESIYDNFVFRSFCVYLFLFERTHNAQY